MLSYYYAKFQEKICVGTDERYPFHITKSSCDHECEAKVTRI